MKAMVIDSYGAGSVFRETEMDKPIIKKGTVLIKVMASSINPIDVKIRAGAVPAASPELPAVLHGDVAGIIEEVGEGVDNFKAGDEVFGCAGGFKGTGGALAEYMLADARLLAHKPKNITMKQAAILPLVSITAWDALFEKGNVSAGQKVLIHGGTGGVGHVAIQLAKWKGAEVFTTVSSDEKAKIAISLGADTVINYKLETVEEYVEKYTQGNGFQTVFDTVGGSNLDKSFQAAAVHGTVLAIAARSTHDLSPMHAKGLSLHVTFMLLKIIDEASRKEHGTILQKIAEIVEEGKLKPLVDDRDFLFTEADSAHKYLESGKATGKISLINSWK